MPAGGPKPIRLPPLEILRVHAPKQKFENPCIAVMSTVLSCWASAGYSAAGCVALENQLRQCMDGPKPTPAPPSTVNYHLKRMQKYVTNQGKRK
ncbi:mitochondrial ribosomal protein 10 [Sarocladium strictum]